MFAIFIWVSVVSGITMVLLGIVAWHLRNIHSFLKKTVRVEVKKVYKQSDKTDINGFPLYDIEGKLQKIPRKVAFNTYQMGSHICDVPYLYLHLDGRLDNKMGPDEVVFSESTVLLEDDYVIQTKE